MDSRKPSEITADGSICIWAKHFEGAITHNLFRSVGIVIFWASGILMHVWSVGALYYCSFPPHPSLRLLAALAYVLVVLKWIFSRRPRTRALLVSLSAFLAVALWFSRIQPKTDAVYPKELARAAFARISGDQVTVHNVRNCVYRSPADFDVIYETREYDLKDLRTVDVYVNYWGMDLIAHTLLAFGFTGGRYLAVSIEIRPEKGEAYGMIKGFFKQYELIYIWADERDLVRLRTNYRNEDMYLYRTTLSPEEARLLFLNMMERTTAIATHPVFYNTCFQSCTNTIGNHINASLEQRKIPFWKRRFLTGTVDRRMYDEGILERSLPFSELRRQANINTRAREADQDNDFSEKIRMQEKSRLKKEDGI